CLPIKRAGTGPRSRGLALGLGLGFLLRDLGRGAATSHRLGLRRNRLGLGHLAAATLLGLLGLGALALLPFPPDTDGRDLVGLQRRQVAAHEDIHLAQHPDQLIRRDAEFSGEVVNSALYHSTPPSASFG